MPSIKIEVDFDEIADLVKDRELVAELRRRGYVVTKADPLLPADLTGERTLFERLVDALRDGDMAHARVVVHDAGMVL